MVKSLFKQRHLRYLEQYRRSAYINLPTSARLNTYLTEIDEQVQGQSHRLIEDMEQAQGITQSG